LVIRWYSIRCTHKIDMNNSANVKTLINKGYKASIEQCNDDFENIDTLLDAILKAKNLILLNSIYKET